MLPRPCWTVQRRRVRCMSCLSGSFSVAAWRISMNFNDFLVSSWTVLTCFGAWRMAWGRWSRLLKIKKNEQNEPGSSRYLWFHSYKLVPLFFLGPRPQHFLNVTHILAWSFMTFTPNRSRQLRSGPSPRRQVSAANSSRCHSCRQGRYAPSPDGSCSLAFFFEMGQNLWNYPLVI